MTWSNCTPRTIRFDKNLFIWNLGDKVQLFFGLQWTSVDSDIKSEIDEFSRFIECSVEWMHDTAICYFSWIPLDDVIEVVKWIATVQKQWQFVFLNEIQLTFEIRALQVGGTKLQSIVVKTTFTNCHNFVTIFFDCRTQFGVVFFWFVSKFGASRRVTTHRYVKAI